MVTLVSTIRRKSIFTANFSKYLVYRSYYRMETSVPQQPPKLSFSTANLNGLDDSEMASLDFLIPLVNKLNVTLENAGLSPEELHIPRIIVVGAEVCYRERMANVFSVRINTSKRTKTEHFPQISEPWQNLRSRRNCWTILSSIWRSNGNKMPYRCQLAI